MFPTVRPRVHTQPLARRLPDHRLAERPEYLGPLPPPLPTRRGLQDCPAVPVSVPIGRLVMHTTAMHALREVHYGSNIKKSLRSLGRKGSLYLFLTYSQALSGSLG